MVFTNREDNTLRLYQSIMTTENKNSFVGSSFIYNKVCHFFLCRFHLAQVIRTAYSKHAFVQNLHNWHFVAQKCPILTWSIVIFYFNKSSFDLILLMYVKCLDDRENITRPCGFLV